MSIWLTIGILAYCVGVTASFKACTTLDEGADWKFRLWFSTFWPVGWAATVLVLAQDRYAGKQRERINEHLLKRFPNSDRPETLHFR
jgi:hypothetical protein